MQRMVVNGVILTSKQTEQFKKFMETSETFQKRFVELSSGKK